MHAGTELQIGGPGQGEDKLRADAHGADDVDGLAVVLDDLFDNGQAQAGAPLVTAPGGVGFVKPLPDLFQAVLGDADACILDGNKRFFILYRRLDLDGGVVVAELDGIVNQGV